MKRPTVAHISTNYLPVVGGIELAIKNISELLFKEGFNVNIVSSLQNRLSKVLIEDINGINVQRIPAIRIIYSELSIPLQMPKKIIKEAKIVHCWSGSSLFPYPICREAKRFGKKVVTYLIGVDYLHYHYNPIIRIFGYPYQKALTKAWLNISNLILVTNEYERKLLNEVYGVDAIILPHGVSKTYIESSKLDTWFRKKYNIDRNVKILAYIGRIHYTKGIDVLIRATSMLVKTYNNIRVIIAGKGDSKYIQKCLSLASRLGIKDYILYLGFIPECDKIGLIDASSAIVLPTRHSGESYPLIIEEVIARRKYVIVSDASRSLASRIINCGFGYVFRKDDPISLAKVAENILKRNGTPSFKCPVHTWEEVVHKLIDIYMYLI